MAVRTERPGGGRGGAPTADTGGELERSAHTSRAGAPHRITAARTRRRARQAGSRCGATTRTGPPRAGARVSRAPVRARAAADAPGAPNVDTHTHTHTCTEQPCTLIAERAWTRRPFALRRHPEATPRTQHSTHAGASCPSPPPTVPGRPHASLHGCSRARRSMGCVRERRAAGDTHPGALTRATIRHPLAKPPPPRTAPVPPFPLPTPPRAHAAPRPAK